MRALVDCATNVAGMVVRIFRGRPDTKDAAVSRGLRTKQPSPCVPVRHLNSPAKLLGILHGLLDFLLRMGWSCIRHKAYPAVDNCQAKRRWRARGDEKSDGGVGLLGFGPANQHYRCRSSSRYWIASPTWFASSVSLPSRSAIVRETRRVLSYARADRPSSVIA